MSNRTPAWGGPCPSPHLPPLQNGAKPLDWHKPGRFAWSRVLAWTCHEHRNTWYELCAAGGLAYIRRFKGDELKPEVAHTHAWREAEARAVWLALLSGRAQ
ncbi:hypothetical protein ACGFIJ_29120 [Microbispora bryophytorum]|uniref:hypothetical protein n=1 Tax=Microbispora bryophytorum TaxID=1460882 RepID=UPI003720523E